MEESERGGSRIKSRPLEVRVERIDRAELADGGLSGDGWYADFREPLSILSSRTCWMVWGGRRGLNAGIAVVLMPLQPVLGEEGG